MSKKELKPLIPGILRSNSRRNIDELLTEALVKRDQQPYNIPDNWVCASLISFSKPGLYSFVDGPFGSNLKVSDYTDKGIRLIQLQNIGIGYWKDENKKYISKKKAFGLTRCKTIPGDIVIAKMAAPIARATIVPDIESEYIIVADCARLSVSKHILPKYLNYYINSPVVRFITEKLGKGVTRKRINLGDLRKLPVPMPPLAEQERLVKKLDSMLKKIAEARELIQEARESFEVRRNTIFHKAFTGKLTKKWREENKDSESASEVLEKIHLERKEISKENFDTKIKTEMILKSEDSPYEIPNTWIWTKLVNFAKQERYSFVDGPFGSNLKTSDYVEHGIRLIQLQNIGDGFWNNENKKYTSEEKANDLLRCKVFPGDIVIAKMASPIARAAIVPDIEREYIIVADCIKISLAAFVLTEYANFCVNSPTFRNIAEKLSKGTTRKRINLKDLKSIPVPLPPFEEQKEIVRILNSLMRSEEEAKELTDLENCLDSLEKSILFKAFRGELGTNIPQDEQAIELLKRILLEKEEMKSIESKQLKRGGDNMDENNRMKNSDNRFNLLETLKEANERLKPEILFERAGYSYETIEEFYRELKIFIENKEIFEYRSNDSEVFLGISNHEDTKTMDKRV